MVDNKPNFLGITDPKWSDYESSSCIIQQLPYEHTSSFKKGSSNGPSAIIQNSHFVECLIKNLYLFLHLQLGTYPEHLSSP